MSAREPLAPTARLASIDDVRGGNAADVRVPSRVVHASSARVVLADETGALELALACEAPAGGTWVIATITRREGAPVCVALEVSTAPLAEFPRPQGDWWWLHADGGRRMRFLHQRARATRAVREWLDGEGFVEVETPLAAPSPGLDVHLDALEVRGGRDARWLVTSPEYQMKRLLSAGMRRIYQLAKCWRANELGERHQPEFTMLEWYRGFASSLELMADTERLVAHVARALTGGTMIPARGRTVDVAPPWDRLTVAEAFERYAGVRVEDVLPDEERFFLLLTEKIEPQLGHPRPVFLTEWPASMASLARLVPGKPHVAERFEAFVDGMELCNGFGELADAREQRRRLVRDQQERERLGKPVYPIDERFLAALEEGIPESGGNALGFDRLLMLVLGARTIDDVVAFSDARL